MAAAGRILIDLMKTELQTREKHSQTRIVEALRLQVTNRNNSLLRPWLECRDSLRPPHSLGNIMN